MRKIKITYSEPGKISADFDAPEKLASDSIALFFRVPKSYSSSPKRCKTNMEFISHLQETLFERCGRNIPCFIIPDDVEIVQVKLSEASEQDISVAPEKRN